VSLSAARPGLFTLQAQIASCLLSEERSFIDVLHRGSAALESHFAARPGVGVDAALAFHLHSSLGFPLDLITTIAAERNTTVDVAGFERLLEAERDKSRALHSTSNTVIASSTIFCIFRLFTQSYMFYNVLLISRL
jgi:alanyl-tRNA synthetase